LPFYFLKLKIKGAEIKPTELNKSEKTTGIVTPP